MNAQQIINIGKDLYEFARTHEKPISDGERLLFDACVAMKQLQADNDALLAACEFALKCTKGGYDAEERNKAAIKVRRLLKSAITKATKQP